MVERDLGQATIVYEDREGEPQEKTVQNEHIAYFQDHWIIKTGEHERGQDIVRRIPANRVYHVERSVQQFEEEIKTLRDQVQSVADDLRTRILGSGGSGGSGGGGGGSSRGPSSGQGEGRHIDVEERKPGQTGTQNR